LTHPPEQATGSTWDITTLTPPPVGARLLRSADDAGDVPIYRGISYCDAVRRAGEGQALRVLPGSIQVCHWAPVTLGLKEPENRFEHRLAPRLDFPSGGLLLAPLDDFPGEPEVVLLRARLEVLQELVRLVGQEWLWDGHRDRLAWSAVPLLTDKPPRLHHPLIDGVNRVLAVLARSALWRAFTHRLFRSHLVTAGWDAVISHGLADMSLCRNSTIIPLQTGRVNISFFCTGGITWGRNDPDNRTSGWPWPLFRRIYAHTNRGVP
jgi:hypothetical protein